VLDAGSINTQPEEIMEREVPRGLRSSTFSAVTTHRITSDSHPSSTGTLQAMLRAFPATTAPKKSLQVNFFEPVVRRGAVLAPDASSAGDELRYTSDAVARSPSLQTLSICRALRDSSDFEDAYDAFIALEGALGSPSLELARRCNMRLVNAKYRRC
jgi:hypothetical protein